MKRMLKNFLIERLVPEEESLPAASFDDLLVRELRNPTDFEQESGGESDIARSGGLSVDSSPEVLVDSTAQENDRLRAELLPRNGAPTPELGHRPVFNETGRLTPETMFQQPSSPEASQYGGSAARPAPYQPQQPALPATGAPAPGHEPHSPTDQSPHGYRQDPRQHPATHPGQLGLQPDIRQRHPEVVSQPAAHPAQPSSEPHHSGQAQPTIGQPQPGQAMPGLAVPGQAVPGQAMPDEAVPGQAMPGQPLPSQFPPTQPQPHQPGQQTLPNQVPLKRAQPQPLGRDLGPDRKLTPEGRVASPGSTGLPPARPPQLLPSLQPSQPTSRAGATAPRPTADGAAATQDADQARKHRDPARPVQTAESELDFWDRFDAARAAANLFSVPASAMTVIIGPLEVAVGVAKQAMIDRADCDVFVLTERAEIPGQPTWRILSRPSEVVQVMESGASVAPLIVLDIPRELPAWVRPLVVRLRQSGVGMVHYVLDDDPSDEDLATWHGELGRPSVLDLAAYVEPNRVVDLLDRGEPIASVAGMPISTDLLLALRLEAE